MTEDEARKKWCPMVNLNINDTNCIASDCMMWRCEKDDYAKDCGKDIPPDRGYCGLAGKPA